jgi:hypothetical protein
MRYVFASALVLLCGVATVALADVRSETFARTSLLTGIGSSEVTSVVEYQGDKKTDARSTRIVGGLVGAIAGKPQSATEITRLDRDLIWDVHPARKSYTERAIAAPASESASFEARGQASGQRPPYRVAKSELKVTKTGQSRTINDFACAEYLLTWELVLEDTASRQQVGQLMTIDMWNTPLTDRLRQAQEVEAGFNRGLAEKRGLTSSSGKNQLLGLGMLTSLYGLDPVETSRRMEEVAKELSKIEGYSVVTEVKWQVKPDTTAKKPEPEPEPRPGSLGGMLADKLAQKIAPQPAKSDEGVVFSSYLELKSVSVGPLPDSDFEVPAGYKLEKH